MNRSEHLLRNDPPTRPFRVPHARIPDWVLAVAVVVILAGVFAGLMLLGMAIR